jgi:hypothetical protein
MVTVNPCIGITLRYLKWDLRACANIPEIRSKPGWNRE